jgi:peptidoglycan hydrolase CwlO-like protein
MRIPRRPSLPVRAAIAAAVAVALITASGTSAPLRARPASDTATKLSEAQSQLQEVLSRVKSATARERRIEEHLATLLAQLDRTRREVESTTATLADLEYQQQQAQAAVTAQQRLVDERAADAYTDPVNPIDVVLGATSLDDLQSRVDYLGAIAQSDQQVVAALASRKQALSQSIVQTDRLRVGLDAMRASLDTQASTVTDHLVEQQQVVAELDAERAEGRALVKRLHDRLARERALAALNASNDPKVPPPLPGRHDVRSMIQREFAPQGPRIVNQALCVAQHESGFDPNAVNPSSGAAGVFQFLPSTWAAMSVAAGYPGSSAFDASANVAVAAWTEGRYGWSPWVLDGPYCGF